MADPRSDRTDKLVGEIVCGRYAVLERTAADRYKVFDMKELRQRDMLHWDDQWLPLPTGSVPPPIPAAVRAARPARPARRRVATNRFEAAWYAHGELLELGEADVEVLDYQTYQAHLEEKAAQLDARSSRGSSDSKDEQHGVLILEMNPLG